MIINNYSLLSKVCTIRLTKVNANGALVNLRHFGIDVNWFRL